MRFISRKAEANILDVHPPRAQHYEVIEPNGSVSRAVVDL